MKKLIILITLTITLIITGCSQSKGFRIETQDLTEDQSQLLILTGNRVFKYKLKNLPNDKTYELKLIYEVYKNNEKIKEEQIIAFGYEPTDEKLEDTMLSINIQDDKIRCTSGGAYSDIDIKEDISKLSYTSFSSDSKIQLGDEIYLFHGVKGKNSILDTSYGKLSKKDKNKYIKDNEVNVFVKLVCEDGIK